MLEKIKAAYTPEAFQKAASAKDSNGQATKTTLMELAAAGSVATLKIIKEWPCFEWLNCQKSLGCNATNVVNFYKDITQKKIDAQTDPVEREPLEKQYKKLVAFADELSKTATL